MTEAEWLACSDPYRMLRYLRYGSGGAVSGRVARLLGRHGPTTPERLREFCLACYREAELAESAAPAIPEDAAFQAAKAQVDQDITRVSNNAWEDEARWGWDAEISSRATSAGRQAEEEAEAGRADSMQYYGALQTDLIRDMFPFQTLPFDPNWLTSTVTALARGIDEAKAFDRLPILADALQDAGCDNDVILNHCRGRDRHFRGCFCVELCLGKALFPTRPM